MSMRIVHTLSGKPMAGNTEVRMMQPWLYAASALYVKKYGQARMVLYTDGEGLKILRPILDLYDEIRPLNIPSYISPRFFAYIKFLAMKKEPLGSVHIDGDVFLKEDKCFTWLQKELKRSDVVTQGIEPNEKPYTETAYYDRIGVEFPCNIHHNLPCNTGLVAFMNQELKDMYFNNYFRIARVVSKKNDFDGCNVADIVPEQAMLSALTFKHGYHMGQMVPGLDWGTIQENANEIGYCHLWAESKKEKLRDIKTRVRLMDSGIFDKIAKSQKVYPSTYIGTF